MSTKLFPVFLSMLSTLAAQIYIPFISAGVPDAGVQVAGEGAVAGMLRSLVESLSLPLASPAPSPVSCLPDPYPPDLQRYSQIGFSYFFHNSIK